jgi:phosphosulfolactate synthase (CoM biosynthesis protein A)
MKEIEKAEMMLRIKMMEEVKNKVPMEERILFKAMTKEQQILFLEQIKQKKPLE